jgi:hypothetical protein
MSRTVNQATDNASHRQTELLTPTVKLTRQVH